MESVTYLEGLNRLLSIEVTILDRRSADLVNSGSLAQSAAVWEALVDEARSLAAQVRAVDVPTPVQALNTEAIAFFDVVVEWNSLELEHARTGVDSHRISVNRLLPEVNAREAQLQRNTDNAKFVLHLAK